MWYNRGKGYKNTKGQTKYMANIIVADGQYETVAVDTELTAVAGKLYYIKNTAVGNITITYGVNTQVVLPDQLGIYMFDGTLWSDLTPAVSFANLNPVFTTLGVTGLSSLGAVSVAGNITQTSGVTSLKATTITGSVAGGGILRLDNSDTVLTSGQVVNALEFYQNDISAGGTGIGCAIRTTSIDNNTGYFGNGQRLGLFVSASSNVDNNASLEIISMQYDSINLNKPVIIAGALTVDNTAGITASSTINLLKSTTITGDLFLNGTDTGTSNVSTVQFYESNGTVRQGYLGFGSSSNTNFTINSVIGDLVFQAGGTSNVLIASSTAISLLKPVTLAGDLSLTGLLKQINKTSVTVLCGGTTASISSGALIVLEGIDYGGSGLGGNLSIVPSSGKAILLNKSVSTTPDTLQIAGSSLLEGNITQSAGVASLKATTISGNLTVNGVLSKSSGSFRIPHPLPELEETHHLVHSFVEAPQADNIYRGKAKLVKGKATVNIDTVAGMTEGTFTALNREVQIFTTNESGWNMVRGSVEGNIITIEAQTLCTDLISWMVIGERKDKHMYDTGWTDENGKVIVEPEIPVELIQDIIESEIA